MKKLFILSFCLLTSAFLLQAQAPQGIPYQAIARNASGVAIASTAVKVRFSIRDSIATGPVRYQETHNPTTSALGLFSVTVGMGTVVSGTFSGINWGKNAKFLQVELDPAGGNSYTDLGTTQMMSVPYALQANAIKMRTSATGDTLYTGGGNYVVIPGISVANPPSNWNGSTLTDIDGNVYQTVQIGAQVWMKENLKSSRYKNGDEIFVGQSAWYYYNNDKNIHNIHGKLYNWSAVVDSRGLCPTGWHVPSDLDWFTLENFLDPSINDPNAVGERGIDGGGKLKSISSHWNSPNTGANDAIGFSALPSGYRAPNGVFNFLGRYTQFWTSTAEGLQTGWLRSLSYTRSTISRGRDVSGEIWSHSVRCIKD